MQAGYRRESANSQSPDHLLGFPPTGNLYQSGFRLGASLLSYMLFEKQADALLSLASRFDQPNRATVLYHLRPQSHRTMPHLCLSSLSSELERHREPCPHLPIAPELTSAY